MQLIRTFQCMNCGGPAVVAGRGRRRCASCNGGRYRAVVIPSCPGGGKPVHPSQAPKLAAANPFADDAQARRLRLVFILVPILGALGAALCAWLGVLLWT